MRSVGGACVGLAAGLAVGCASPWKPPPEPPPPAPVSDAPSKYKPFRGLEWDAGTRRIGCGPGDFTVPADLAAYVRMNGPDELVIVPSGSPPGSALMARIHDPSGGSKLSDMGGGLFAWLIDKVAEKVTLGYELLSIARLHAMANGQTPEEWLSTHETARDGGAQDGAEVTLKDDVLEITYTMREEAWRLVGLSAEHCFIMTIERISPHATNAFGEIQRQMRASAHNFKTARF